MKKKLWIIISAVVVAVVVAVSMIFAFRHEHTYSSDWSKNETHHWHDATCEHTNQKSKYEKHNYDNDADKDCNTCGFIRESSTFNMWDGTTAEVPTANNLGEIVITTAEQFAGFAQAVNAGETFEDKTILLDVDIDLMGRPWTPIGLGTREDVASAKMFKGKFNGRNHTIYGLTNNGYTPADSILTTEGEYTETTVKTYNYGLFGMVSGATIKNLNLVDVDINCDASNLKGDSVGGLVGFSTGALTIDRCSVSGTIVGGFDSIGGIVGRVYATSSTAPAVITNCVNNANVTGAFKSAGIVGYVASSTLNCTISGCENKGDITATGAVYYRGNTARSASFVSGIVNYGWNGTMNTMIIKNNTNRGNIISTPTETHNIYHGLAYIANSVYNNFKDPYLYDFTGNQNIVDAVNGKGYAYDLGEPAEVVYLVVLNQTPFSARGEVNGTKNIVED